MKRKLSNFIMSIIVITLTVPFIFSGCGSKKNSEEITLITNFIETFFTDPRPDNELYKGYFTQDAYTEFCNNRWSGPAYRIGESTQSGESDRFGSKVDMEIKDLKIKTKESSDEDVHSYDVTFILTEKNTNVEKEFSYYFNLSEEDGSWKLNNSNLISNLHGDLSVFLEEVNK